MVKNHPFTVIPGGLSGSGQFRTPRPAALSGNDSGPDDEPCTLTLPDHVRREMEKRYGPHPHEERAQIIGELSGAPAASFLGRFLFGWGPEPDGSSDIHP